MDKNDALDAHALLVAALRDPAAYPHPVSAVEVINTHISSVLLAGEYAYKLKKPVDLGFVDFSTLARRHHCCDEEIRLNRRSAPSLYLDVVPITSSPIDAKPRIGGEDAPLDYAVRMRRFAGDARLDQMARAGTLDASLIDRLAATIAAFHSHCAHAPEHNAFGTAETILALARANLVELRRSIALQEQRQGQQRIDRLAQWTEAEFARRADVFATRRAEGFVRECHGDLHLANLALIDGEPVPFDCIEFNPQLRFIDVMSDVAFTWMDLLDHGLPQLAARLLNGYLEATGDYAGLASLRFYAVYRALVRALVALIRRGQSDSSAAEQMSQEQACARYLEVAERIMQVSPSRVLLVSGVTGSGKTTVAQHLLERLGAVRVRSDVERKRRAGLAATERRPERVGAGLYDAETTRVTYEQLARATTAIVDAGFPAVVDATFQRRSDRQLFRALATRLGARLALVVCEASPQTLRARVAARAARGADASDATLAVLEHQLQSFESLAEDEVALAHGIDTDTDPATLAMRCEKLATALGASSRSDG